MATLDMIISGGTIATSSETYKADIGVKDGKIAVIADKLVDAENILDANRKLVIPGGIEAHCHIEQESGMGIMAADDYKSGSISAALVGTLL